MGEKTTDMAGLKKKGQLPVKNHMIHYQAPVDYKKTFPSYFCPAQPMEKHMADKV